MDSTSELPPPPPRIDTGIPGLDAVTRGGLFKAGIYILIGAPGSGKTIFAHQLTFHHVERGGRGLYVTLLSETHARMLGQMQVLKFFQPHAVGTSLKYVNGFSTIESGGLEALLKLLREAVREHRADLLVLDGMITAGALAKSSVDYKKFINELQTWVGVIGCTVLFLTSAGTEAPLEPEHTMVDGIFEMDREATGLRSIRYFSVTKFRGSAFTEGKHPYVIGDDGLTIYPRVEAHYVGRFPAHGEPDRATFGIPQLDKMLAGGVARHSTTLLLGSSGSGKTILGLQFLAEGTRRGEQGIHFGFYENPTDLTAKADRLGLDFSRLTREGALEILWQPPAEGVLDVLAQKLFDAVNRQNARRLFIDGLVGFNDVASRERLSSFFSVLVEELACRGVTTLITEETRELFIQHLEIPTIGVSAIFHNIIFLRQVEVGAELSRLIAVMKTRDTIHDHGLYQFEITHRGIQIGPRFKPAEEAILTGSAPLHPGVSTGKRGKRRGTR